ncbi:MAG: hypothetical protein JNJ57_05745 [Saprospiraceae bacterium]|nr:hypothetical protein [Saprospiraceae bacterium]
MNDNIQSPDMLFRKIYFSLLILFITWNLSAQVTMTFDVLPYHEIPAAPETFTAENTVARMIDGLGFRYFWATEGLQTTDLSYRPTEGARSCEETLDHIMGLSIMILNAVQNKTNVRSGEETSPAQFAVKRKTTLDNLKKASDLLKERGSDLNKVTIKFKNKDQKSEFPAWNLINGPISDALWHAGQVVSFRRSSGNPINPKVNVFTGKLND